MTRHPAGEPARHSRRSFLARLGAGGALQGADALRAGLQALGLALPALATQRVAASAPLPQGRGTRVLVLGAGIAGLTAAWELTKAGYDCTLLEAAPRAGGRIWTLRRGDELRLDDGSVQRCSFAAGLHFDAGAARFPAQHGSVLAACRELCIELEPAIIANRNALLRSATLDDGAPRTIASIVDATRAQLATLLEAALRGGAAPAETTLTAADVARIRDFLATWRGHVDSPGTALLDSTIWQWIALTDGPDLQPVMLQPKGGMDRIVAALAQRLGSRLRLGCEVLSIRELGDRVRVGYRSRGIPSSTGTAGHDATLDASFCVCTLPPHLLKALDTDLQADARAALEAFRPENASKIAWQAPRFWETTTGIFGGTSFTGGPTATVGYPSEGFLASQGILIGAYTTGFASRWLAGKDLAAQYAASRAAVEALHPGHGRELAQPLAISWQKVPHIAGAWSRPRKGTSAEALAAQLARPGARLFFAGDHLSALPGWQEGAIRSAHAALAELTRAATAA